jgi:hypothetical protein
MIGPSPSGSLEQEMRCPACRAVQPWSDACRRCKCDLSLLHGAMAVAEEHRLHSLNELRRARWPQALHHARQAHDLCPGEDTARLLAVCHLLCEDWPSALAVAGGSPGRSGGNGLGAPR